MINRFRQARWALFAPFSGLLGWFWLKSIALKEDPSSWPKGFYGKKVLIVGSGPSLDKVNNEYYEEFDSIVYINHAVKASGKLESEFFFSTDVDVVENIHKKEYFSNIINLGQSRSILAPIFFQQTLCLSSKFRNNFSWIKASNCAYKFHWLSGRYKVPVTLVLWPDQPDVNALDAWFNQRQQVRAFPVVEKTSALSAILLAAKYRPKSITLIGCDFGIGRAKDIENDCPGHTTDIFGGAAERFEFIKSYLEKKNIHVNNDSWNL